MRLRQILGFGLLVLALSGCSFPDAGVWRAIAYTKIADSQAHMGDMRGARESAALALESAWHVKGSEASNWAKAAAVAAQVHAGDAAGARALTLRRDGDWRDEPALRLYLLMLAQLEGGDITGARRSLDDFWAHAAGGDGDTDLEFSTLALFELGDFSLAQHEALRHEDPSVQARLLATIAVAQARANLVVDALATLGRMDAISDRGTETATIDFVVQIARAIAGTGMDLFPFLLREPVLSEGLGEHSRSYVLTEIALAQVRRGEAAAAAETVDRIPESVMRVRALSLVAIALAEGGDPAGARTFAARALALAAGSAPEAMGWAIYASERTNWDDPAAVVALSASESAPVWTAVALAQAERGDFIAMRESLAQARQHLEPKSSEGIAESQANWAWIMAIGGDIAGALEMADRISKEDRRAFGLVPAVTALAELGDWISATEVAKGMLDGQDARLVTERIDVLRAQLLESEMQTEAPAPSPWYARDAFNLELLRTLRGVPLAEASGDAPPLGAEELLSLAERTRDPGLRARLFAWAAELQAAAGQLEAAKAGIETARHATREDLDPYGRSLALVEIAHAQAVLGAVDAALATLAEAAELAAEISLDG